MVGPDPTQPCVIQRNSVLDPKLEGADLVIPSGRTGHRNKPEISASPEARISSERITDMFSPQEISKEANQAQGSAFRPPAVPLVTHDPYFSVWQFANTLTEDWSRHWTGAIQAMCGMIRVDGKTYRFAGPEPRSAEPMRQRSVEVHPTRTEYLFEAGGIEVRLTFISPLLADDMDLASRPVTYVTFDVRAIDRKPHSVAIYYDVTAEWATTSPRQLVEWSKHHLEDLHVLKVGTQEQPVLEKSGDNLRIDWGHLYLAYGSDVSHDGAICGDRTARETFSSTGLLMDQLDLRMPREVRDDYPVLACTFDLGAVEETVSRHLLLGYDDEFSVEYFGQKLKPYWRRDGATAFEMVSRAERDFEHIAERCRNFDRDLTRQLESACGAKYAQLAALAYRQCIAAHKIVAGPSGEPLMFSKENFSNGCIGTVDVTYPAAPFFLHFNMDMLKAQLTPVFEYAQSPRWPHLFAPHDLGTYPLANGQVYGGAEESERDQMPVEECGNMLILAAAISKREGNAVYAKQYWTLLEQWAKYLLQKGLDPENQLCTDDFAGHLAHNANLSLKAILALGAFALLCDMAGKKAKARDYRSRAHQMAADWVLIAADRDHYRLAFDKKGSWSQKYNLVWDGILELGLFDTGVAEKEIAYYVTKQNEFGLPLDSRQSYTKLDWIAWTASLTSDSEIRERLIAPIFEFANRTASRVPLPDWYSTKDATQIEFQARSVVGGLFILLLGTATPLATTLRQDERVAVPAG